MSMLTIIVQDIGVDVKYYYCC